MVRVAFVVVAVFVLSLPGCRSASDAVAAVASAPEGSAEPAAPSEPAGPADARGPTGSAVPATPDATEAPTVTADPALPATPATPAATGCALTPAARHVDDARTRIFASSAGVPAIYFRADMDVNTDGSSRSYHPDDPRGRTLALNNIANAISGLEDAQGRDIDCTPRSGACFTRYIETFIAARDAKWDPVGHPRVATDGMIPWARRRRGCRASWRRPARPGPPRARGRSAACRRAAA